MLEHTIHIGFVSEPVDTSLFDSYTWHKGSVFLIVGKNHPLAGRASIKLKELQDDSVIVFSDDKYPQNMLASICVRNGIIPAFYLEGYETGLFRELCASNKIAALWEGSTADYPDLVSLEIEDLNAKFQADFIVQKNVYLNEAERNFIEYAKANLPIRP
jgi:hypothetical protein